jgi:hypothetical protein
LDLIQQFRRQIRVQSTTHLTQYRRALRQAGRRSAIRDKRPLNPAQAFRKRTRLTDSRSPPDSPPKLLEPTRFVQKVCLLRIGVSARTNLDCWKVIDAELLDGVLNGIVLEPRDK